MRSLNALWAGRRDWFNPVGREQRIKDYIALANQLVWQRQASFLSAAVLAAFYFDPYATLACYAVVVLTEILDQLLARQSRAWDGKDPVAGRRILQRIARNTAVSATAISLFIISMAVQQTSGGHFTPLFFLFSAALFAAMHNSQMVGILLLRLSIYAAAFLFIALLDLVRYMPPLGSQVWLEFFTIIFVLYFIVDTSVHFYLNYQERIAHMRRIEEENERTKAAYEVKSQFLSTVSHELRTPLTSIKASLDLANNGVLGAVPDGLKPAIGIAAKNAQRLAALIDDLLDLQKIEAGEMVFNFEPVDVNTLVKEAVEATSGFATKLGIQVSTVPCAEACHVRGDHSRLIQVMNNLLSNAVKFSEDGGAVKVIVETDGARVRISVHDEGVGIPQDAQDRVFGKFSQVDSSDIRKVGGTGLGLNISKQIIERHDATIDYVSELGVGSTFFLEFDRLEGADTSRADDRPIAKVA
ncbi:sensor histidine kinase [Roseicyclus persicicus]|uniref:histidine kinase n=1 Tax=Roseicyclus persicicus TaxID=2650661 RepID=A0A7X6H0W4_9RHOB|nr:HAMP domain-containing sensor histidine kinase [Roseibacterium persicicum]NKX45920.1 HAMP domain-containing histidine kinase [Roseibacterium persicicum]